MPVRAPVQKNDRWTFATWFSGFGAADYVKFKEELISDIAKMRTKASSLREESQEIAVALKDFEMLMDRLGHLSSYLECLLAENADDEPVKTEKASIATLDAEATKLHSSFESLLASLPDKIFQAILASAPLKGAEHTIQRMQEVGKHKMKPPMEELAADLNVDGLHAWGRLYSTLASQMQFSMTFPDGHTEIVPMAKRRALMADPNRALRKAAFEEGQKPWNDHAETLAACLNGIAGTRLSLYKHRKTAHFLDLPLFESALSKKSLDALLEAIRRDIELPRRSLRAAARLQGTKALHYYDLEAPQIVAPDETSLPWEKACEIVGGSFSSAYPELGAYFRDMLQKNWIEAEPRPAKLPGAFCTGSRWKKEERVYMSFHGGPHDLVTLAHEVGHAWHSYVLRPKRSFASHYPMTLAETASNFGEMLVLDSLMQEPKISPKKKASLIDQQMLRAHAYLLNILMRYEFENAFYTKRAEGELSVSKLRDLMSKTQLDIYGDTLLPDGTDPMFWAYKMHFFITDLSFYNFPYVFGYLLSQALFARFKEEGASFLPHYKAFLSETGNATCEEVARETLGVDLTNPDFWSSAVRTIEPTIREYEALASKKSSKKAIGRSV